MAYKTEEIEKDFLTSTGGMKHVVARKIVSRGKVRPLGGMTGNEQRVVGVRVRTTNLPPDVKRQWSF